MNKNTQQDKQQFVEDLKQEWNIIDKKKDEEQQTEISIPIRLSQSTRERKLTKKTKKIYLEHLKKDWNLTLAAASVNVSRRAIDHLLKRDSLFKEAFDDIKMYHLDNAEAANITLSRLPSREGFPDRRLLLETHHPAYQRNPEIQVNTQINFEPTGQVKSILSRILPNDDD